MVLNKTNKPNVFSFSFCLSVWFVLGSVIIAILVATIFLVRCYLLRKGLSLAALGRQVLSELLTIPGPWCAWARRRGRRSLHRSRECRRMRFPWLSWRVPRCRICSDRATLRVRHGIRPQWVGCYLAWRGPKNNRNGKIRARCRRACLLTVTVLRYLGSSQFSARMQRRASLRSKLLQTSLRPLTSPIRKETFVFSI